MKPSIQAQNLNQDTFEFYPVLNKIFVATDADSCNFDFKGMKQYTFSCTLDRLFSTQFLQLVQSQSICLRSLSAFSEQSELSISLSTEGILTIAMSQRLYESSGLEAAQTIVDSVVFSSTCRLMTFDLKSISVNSARLMRIQERSKILSKELYSCQFVALCSINPASSLGVPVAEEASPVFKSKSVANFPWAEASEDVSIPELVEWMALVFKNPNYKFENVCRVPGMKVFSLEGSLLPSFLLSELVSKLLPESTRTLIYVFVDPFLPPQPRLNEMREKHFNPSKFDPTMATADQQALYILKDATETKVYRLNITA